MISREYPNLRLGFHPHLFDNLPSFPQQTPYMHSRHHKPRRHAVPSGPSAPSGTVLLVVLRHPERGVALENPLVDQQQRLLRRREGRHSPLGIAAARVGNLDDPLLVPRHELVHVDPRAGVLPYRLYDAAGLANDAAGLQVVAENAVAGGDRQR